MHEYIYQRTIVSSFPQNSKPNSYSKLERRAIFAETATSHSSQNAFSWHTNVDGAFVLAL